MTCGLAHCDSIHRCSLGRLLEKPHPESAVQTHVLRNRCLLLLRSVSICERSESGQEVAGKGNEEGDVVEFSDKGVDVGMGGDSVNSE